jgi:hypothetical protein
VFRRKALFLVEFDAEAKRLGAWLNTDRLKPIAGSSLEEMYTGRRMSRALARQGIVTASLLAKKVESLSLANQFEPQ